MPSVQHTRDLCADRRASRESTASTIVIVCAGLTAELILPWVLIWLSDTFLFDAPGWSQWLVFVGPPVLTLMAVLIHRVFYQAAT